MISMATTKYSLMELMTVIAAREVADGEIVFAGTGLPMLGVMLAQKTHAPGCIIIFEAGAGPRRARPAPSARALLGKRRRVRHRLPGQADDHHRQARKAPLPREGGLRHEPRLARRRPQPASRWSPPGRPRRQQH